MPSGYPNPLTAEERETIKQMLLDGVSMVKIAEAIGRSAATVQKVKNELGLVSREKIITRKTNCSVQALCNQWHWKNPREEKKKPVTKKRDWWAKEHHSQFRTPYHYPGKPY